MTKESPPSKASARPTKMGTTRSPRGAMMQRPTKRPGHITDCDLALRLMDSCLPDLADGPVPFDCGRFDQSAGTSAPQGPAAICVEHHVCPDFERKREDSRTRLCANKEGVVMRVAKL